MIGRDLPRFRNIIKELRLEFLTGSVTPVLLSTALARHDAGRWSPPVFALTAAGVIFLHLGANTANDYFDHLSGNDAANVDYVRPFTGGSRLIQEGLISPGAVLAISIAMFAGALFCGTALIAMRGIWVAVLGLFGAACGYFYTGTPLKLAHRGIGEAAIFLSFGSIGLGAYYVQAGTVTGECILISLPLAFLITAIIVINEFQDSEADSGAGKRTLVVRLGRKRAVYLFGALILAAYIPIVAGAVSKASPLSVLAALVTAPIAAKAVATAAKNYDYPEGLAPANGAAILTHLLTGAILTLAYIISG